MAQHEIGLFIGALRKAGGMTQRELADRLGVSDKSVSRWERGDGLPDLMLIPVIAEVFDITCDELLAGRRSGVQNQKPQQTGNQQIQRLCAVAVESLKFYTVVAILLTVLAPMVSTALWYLAVSRTTAGLMGTMILLVAMVVEWLGLSQYRQRLDVDILTTELRCASWKKIFPYLSAFGGMATFAVVCLFYKDFCIWGDWLQAIIRPELYNPAYLQGRLASLSMILAMVVTVSLFFGWMHPYFVTQCIKGGLLPQDTPRKKGRYRTARVLGMLLLVTAVLRILVTLMPYGVFVEGRTFENIVQLQSYLDEKKPIFTTEAQEKKYVAEKNKTVTDQNGKHYNYQNYSSQTDIVWTDDVLFPVSVYTASEQERGQEVRSYLYEGLYLGYFVEIAVCGGVYLCLRWSAVRKMK